MQLNEIHHVSINVKDVEAAEQFYVGVLGLQALERPDLGFPGIWLQVGRQQIHLMKLDFDVPVKEQHFAFHVDDIEAIRAELKQSGVPLTESREIPGACLQAFTHDPSGNMIEFNQPL
ncbi:MAG: VOC family protein [Pseudomonadales bacterium]|mgnify:CR=1 FL=1|jgi:glyoxylase I family protein|nr:lactoylglutathione lyase [Gammaproteobacteria bacterium]MDP6024272.1 VOC family protein [Pseudomonadales bacterium]MDP7452041.1 VOC family protein [Arenicellales bacterium]MDP7315708.1 VOC family protein [Pseudomonadales bacterium]MDP7577650.1 VOC family protein [Pseudomonadales bacterium]|tara:strand:- start:1236 stop:1589 length:354 start_codon:yes stop_codon:yes gene_type:complete